MIISFINNLNNLSTITSTKQMSTYDENTSLIFEQAKQVLMQYDSVIKSIDHFDKEKEQTPVE